MLLKFVINAIALYLAGWLVEGVHLTGNPVEVAIAAIVFGIVNTFIKPIVMLLSLPMLVLTLGLFTFVVNAAMLGLVAAVTQGLVIDHLYAALVGSSVISIASVFLSLVLKD